jgi:hypothetical protein
MPGVHIVAVERREAAETCGGDAMGLDAADDIMTPDRARFESAWWELD